MYYARNSVNCLHLGKLWRGMFEGGGGERGDRVGEVEGGGGCVRSLHLNHPFQKPFLLPP
jgi:hypothetical protein